MNVVSLMRTNGTTRYDLVVKLGIDLRWWLSRQFPGACFIPRETKTNERLLFLCADNCCRPPRGGRRRNRSTGNVCIVVDAKA
jgi:hypothetical protein